MMAAGPPTAAARIAYGAATHQFADLWLPELRTGRIPVVVLVHGGFWRAIYGLDLMDPLAADLAARGFAVWNIEYRRVGHDGGGYPGTLTDVAAAIDALASLDVDLDLDLDAVTLIGHSAGGHLAFWAAGRDLLRGDAPGAAAVVAPRRVIGLGPVGDLVVAAEHGAGNGAVLDFIGGAPDEHPDRYAIANPNIGRAVDVVVVRAGDDEDVLPPYTVPAAAGAVTEVDVAGEDHMDLIDPASESWRRVIAALVIR